MGQTRQQQLQVTSGGFKTKASAAKQPAEIKATIRRCEQKLKAMQKEHESKLKKKDVQLERMQGDLEDADRRIKKMDGTVKKLRSQLGQQKKSAGILSDRVQSLSKDVKRLTKNKARLEKIIDEQNKRLDVHENAHVPSSKQNHLHQGKAKEKKGKGKGKKASDKSGQQKSTRRGGIRNHAGRTQIFKPTETKKHTADKCPGCGSKNIRDLKKDRRRRIVSIPKVIPHTVTLHKTARYCCQECQNEFSADNGLPANGQFGFSVIQYVSHRYMERMTAQTIADNLCAVYGLDITKQTVEKIYGRGMQMLKPTQEKYAREIERSLIVIPDETTFKGEPRRWIGAYRNKDTVAYVHAPTRSVKDLLSQMKNCKGIPVRDGYSGYNSLYKDRDTQQRCTQHLTREARNTAMRTGLRTAKNLYREISLMFIMVRAWTKEEHSEEERKDMISKLEKWMRRIISRYRKSSNKRMKKCGNTFANALKHMFTFVMYPSVPSTTNLVEQSIRKVIGHRNNRIQLKSDAGADNLCTLLTCAETWKLRKLNVWEELGKRICSSPQV